LFQTILAETDQLKDGGKTNRITMNSPSKFSMPMKNGVMDEEYPFWDNQEFMKQIGLGK